MNCFWLFLKQDKERKEHVHNHKYIPVTLKVLSERRKYLPEEDVPIIGIMISAGQRVHMIKKTLETESERSLMNDNDTRNRKDEAEEVFTTSAIEVTASVARKSVHLIKMSSINDTERTVYADAFPDESLESSSSSRETLASPVNRFPKESEMYKLLSSGRINMIADT
ncbi:hypothetical protein BDB01DRAFT_850341 [Pilobolus umbonatus]|nr:hypothetical protein BDB01DRAFT_850341 [Pilobolus umbonatus]